VAGKASKYRGGVTEQDPDVHVRRLAAQSIAADDPTGWFEQLYAEAEEGRAVVPWFRGAPRPTLVEWAEERGVTGGGRRALVVGSGLGDDAEYVAGLGFDTTAFDISASAVRAARQRFPESTVEYVVADLLHPPAEWREAFDLVVESFNVQALPKPLQPAAIVQVGHLVRQGGTLLVIAFAPSPEDPPEEGPPWPLTRAEVESFAIDGLEPVQITQDADSRWVAEFTRP
jgi:Methyltransferase domain